MPYRKGSAGTAERIHSRLVRARGVCERCGITGVAFECAHIIRRRFVATRTDERNAWCLCGACHRLVDGDAVAFYDLVENTIGRWAFDELHWRAVSNKKQWRASDWQAESARLRARLKEVLA